MVWCAELHTNKASIFGGPEAGNVDTTLSFLEDQIQKKFFSTTDACFHVKLMQGIQKYELILNPTSRFDLPAI